jgi:hypothetical protein
MTNSVYLWYLVQYFFEWKMFQTEVADVETHFMSNNFFTGKSSRLWENAGKYGTAEPATENVEKYGTAKQATDDNAAHTPCMLDTWSYNHTLRVCHTYCFSTATKVTLYVHCLSCVLTVP